MYNLPDKKEIFTAIVERHAREQPDRIFAHSVDDKELTWLQFHECGMVWAARFAAAGVSRHDTIASLCDAGLEQVSWWLGAARLGAIDTAINVEFRGRMLVHAINTCGAKILLVQSNYISQLEQIAHELENITTILVLGDAAPSNMNVPQNTIAVGDLPADVEQFTDHIIEPEWHDIAGITYTSGTTGPSKAVRMPWAQFHSISKAVYPFEDLNSDDVIFSLSPAAHFGAKQMPYLAALIGGKVILRKRFSGSEFWNEVKKYKVTTIGVVASMAEVLMRAPDAPGPETSLRNVFMAPIIPKHKEFNERFGTRVCTIFNSTEQGVAICSDWDPADAQSCGRLRKGYPGFEVRIVDEYDREVPDGEVGEAIVRSSVPWTLNDGYHGNPEATANSWRNGWFHTGDGLKRSVDGDFYFVDRLKDAIRRRGENISSFEVESEVMENPDVVECAAVAAAADEGEDEILLFVVKKEGSNLTPDKLIQDLSARMTRFMVPRYVEFVSELPRVTATHKVMKVELRKQGIGPNTFDREVH